MKITLVIPIDLFDTLLEKCDTSGSEYRLLQDSMITQNDRGEAAEMRCDIEQAEHLILFARQIERGIRSWGP